MQLENNTYNSTNINGIMTLVDDNGVQSGYLFGNKNVQKNIINKTINGTNLLTLKTDKGLLMFLNAPNSLSFQINLKSISKPVFTSGYYLGKNIEIIFEVLNDPSKKRQISVVFL